MPERRLLAPILLTVFLDMVAVGLIIPVAAPLFLGGDSTLFSPDATLDRRAMLLGFLLATAPLVQFISAPLVGAWSDRAGRKNVLTTTVGFNGIGQALFGMGIVTAQIWLMFLGRMFSGVGQGNLSVAHSAVADISKSDDKVRNFGVVGMTAGLGLILGPFLGGQFSDPRISSWFTLATPLWVAAALAFVNIICIMLFFPETIRERLHRALDPLTGFRNVAKAFHMPGMRSLYGVSFLMGAGFNCFAQFFAVFLVSGFGFSATQIGVVFGYVALWFALTQGIIARWLSHRAKPAAVLTWALPAAAGLLLVLAGADSMSTVYVVLPLIAIAYGLNPPNLTTLISEAADTQSQGEALGINQSMTALSLAVPAIIAGIAAGVDASWPLIIAAFSMSLGWLVFFTHRTEATESPPFHEV